MLKAQSAKPCDGAAFDAWPSNPDRLAKATSPRSASSAPPTTTSRMLRRRNPGDGCIQLR